MNAEGQGSRRPVRIANCSGFYGDRLDAARLMVDGGPIDVLTGDYLAELTMLILWKAREGGRPGYARTFVTQVTDVLGRALERGIRIVTNAGGLDPAGLAAAIVSIGAEQGLTPKVAYVTGDDITGRLDALTAAGERFTHLDTGVDLAAAGVVPVTANAYLGGWGIAAALAGGADVVVTGRVTDASLVVGPAAWWHGWARTDWDRLAGAVAAGHVIECGPQATGGNYAFAEEITDRRYPGFPIAEVGADGSSVITKHPGTGGLVSVGTVTAQLLYEIAEPAYPGPDVTTHLDTVHVDQQGPDRVRLSGTRGSPPPPRLKVALNYLGGYRNTMTLVLTGLDLPAKAAWARAELFSLLGGEGTFDDVDIQLLAIGEPATAPQPAATRQPAATAHLRITVKDADQARVGRAFSDATQALVLGGYAGAHTTTPPTAATAYGVYWPATVSRAAVEHRVVLADDTTLLIDHSPATADTPPTHTDTPPTTADTPPTTADQELRPDRSTRGERAPGGGGATVRVALGRLVGARSGDKGGNANVGLWARDDASHAWLRSALDVGCFVELLPEARGLVVRRFELPNLRALNFVVVGLLGAGVASSTRPDPQAKGLGEYLRARELDVPVALVSAGGTPAGRMPAGGDPDADADSPPTATA